MTGHQLERYIVGMHISSISFVKMTKQFMEARKQRCRLYPEIVSDNEMNVIIPYLEKQPLKLASSIIRRDLTGVAEDLGELIYVMFLISHRYGLPIESVVEEIHRSKMTGKSAKIAAILEPHLQASRKANDRSDKISQE